MKTRIGSSRVKPPEHKVVASLAKELFALMVLVRDLATNNRLLLITRGEVEKELMVAAIEEYIGQSCTLSNQHLLELTNRIKDEEKLRGTLLRYLLERVRPLECRDLSQIPDGSLERTLREVTYSSSSELCQDFVRHAMRALPESRTRRLVRALLAA